MPAGPWYIILHEPKSGTSSQGMFQTQAEFHAEVERLLRWLVDFTANWADMYRGGGRPEYQDFVATADDVVKTVNERLAIGNVIAAVEAWIPFQDRHFAVLPRTIELRDEPLDPSELPPDPELPFQYPPMLGAKFLRVSTFRAYREPLTDVISEEDLNQDIWTVASKLREKHQHQADIEIFDFEGDLPEAEAEARRRAAAGRIPAKAVMQQGLHDALIAKFIETSKLPHGHKRAVDILVPIPVLTEDDMKEVVLAAVQHPNWIGQAVVLVTREGKPLAWTHETGFFVGRPTLRGASMGAFLGAPARKILRVSRFAAYREPITEITAEEDLGMNIHLVANKMRSNYGRTADVDIFEWEGDNESALDEASRRAAAGRMHPDDRSRQALYDWLIGSFVTTKPPAWVQQSAALSLPAAKMEPVLRAAIADPAWKHHGVMLFSNDGKFLHVNIDGQIIIGDIKEWTEHIRKQKGKK